MYSSSPDEVIAEEVVLDGGNTETFDELGGGVCSEEGSFDDTSEEITEEISEEIPEELRDEVFCEEQETSATTKSNAKRHCFFYVFYEI